MITVLQKDKAKQFQAMHQQEAMFILPNCHDVMSAKLFANARFQAIATTSAGIAFSYGYADGEYITMDDLELVVKQITKHVEIPLSVDFERGYSDEPEEVKANARRLVCAGAVGFNIEDGKADGALDTIAYQVQKIQALVALKKELDIDFVINARTCVYWLRPDDVEDYKTEAIKRCKAFVEAGADCVFIPALIDEETIAEIVGAVGAPVNILAAAAMHNLNDLNALGVKRCSIGSFAVRSVIQHLTTIANELMEGELETMRHTTIDYHSANALFEGLHKK